MSLFGPKRLGLALGSGSARGLAHIGVLKALEAEGLAPDVVAGTSMGAIVGALYAAGMSAGDIESLARDIDIKDLAGPGDVAIGKGAVFSGSKVETFLREHLPPTFDDLAVPFGCVATDLTRNRPMRFTEGDLVAAVRASISVPLALMPVRMDEMVLVDGYVCEPVPVSLARHLGGQTIVAVEVCGSGTVSAEKGGTSDARQAREIREAMIDGEPYERGVSGLDILGAVSEAFEGRVAATEVAKADIVISPAVHHIAGFEFQQAGHAIEAGEEAAYAAVPAIRRKARR